MLKQFTIGLLVLFFISISKADSVLDPYLWLEDVEGAKALNWVRKANITTDETLGADPLYQEIYNDALEALDSKDKLPNITLRGDWVYRLHKDPEKPRGVYQRISVSDFKANKNSWQTVLDVDKLATDEGVKWVFHGMDCLQPKHEQCLVFLSPGGGDAHEMREFNTKSLGFVNNGFRLPASKMNVSWIDSNQLFVSTDFGEGSMTDSGYPRVTKAWQRNTHIDKAKTVLTVDKESMLGFGRRYNDKLGGLDLLVESSSFWLRKRHQLVDGKAIELKLPASARINGLIHGKLVVSLVEDWSFDGQHFEQGSVILSSAENLIAGKGKVELLLASERNAIIEEVNVNKNSILVTLLEDVKSRVRRFQYIDDSWQSKLVDLPTQGKISIETSNDQTGEFFVRYEDFLTPPTLYSISAKLKAQVIRQQSATFDQSNLTVAQYFALSKDKTRVPYFVVFNKDIQLDGKNPTHMFSYGGFRNSLTPSYSGSYEDLNGAYGKAWLNRGGVYVVANIRGGGEYGPEWHSSALNENKVRSYEDFEAVAEDLIRRNITSAKHLGIEGRSNGGLLVGATMVRRPDLYGAVICGVPLLDMKRYNKLLAGASWMGEFGNPDTNDWEFIKTYSPYQNMQSKVDYPPIFFFTSTKDDRVHPGHARKMAAKMQQMGHHIEYYENTEGGHKGSATSEQTAKRIALSFTHLWRHLK